MRMNQGHMVPAPETVRRIVHFPAGHERVDVSPRSSALPLAFTVSLLVPGFHSVWSLGAEPVYCHARAHCFMLTR